MKLFENITELQNLISKKIDERVNILTHKDELLKSMNSDYEKLLELSSSIGELLESENSEEVTEFISTLSEIKKKYQ